MDVPVAHEAGQVDVRDRRDGRLAVGVEGEQGGGSGDELYDQAVQVVLRDKKVSTSYVQRRLQVGYNKAASLIGWVTIDNQSGKTFQDAKLSNESYFVKKNNLAKPQTKQAQLGGTLGDASNPAGPQWIVTGGLMAGEQGVVDGFQKIRPKAPVSPVPWQAASAPAGSASAPAASASAPKN